MLEVYLSTPFNECNKSIEDLSNDRYFNRHVEGYDFSLDINKRILHDIDGTHIVSEGMVESKFVPGMAISIKSLSTGCKTLLNVVNNPDKVFSLAECGENIIDEVFKLHNGKVVLARDVWIRDDIPCNIKVVFNDKTMVSNNVRDIQDFIDKAFKGEFI